jgi:hypothetical protein
VRVRLDKYQLAHSRMQWRTILLIAGGALGIVVGSFLSFVGLLLLFMPDDGDGTLWSRRSGVTVGVFGGLFPLAIATLMVWRGVAGRLSFKRMRELAAFARAMPRCRS